jgi:5,5'-dehydrodivanillate O-demethylase oxygenase subunit
MELHEDFAHTGPGTPAGRFMRSFWQPVGLTEDLKQGCALPIAVMGEEFTLYRGETGTPHVVAGRCAHRGTQLSVGWVEGDCIRCFYHGWKYDQTGQCVEQALEVPSFAGKVQIPSYPVYEYLGLIFAYFGEGEPPEPPRYPEYESGVVVDPVTMRVPYNYFQNMENSVDTLHVSWVHRRSNFFADSRLSDFGNGNGRGAAAIEGMIKECWAEETEYGFVFYDVFENGKVKTSFFEIPNILHINVYPIDAESGWRDFVAWKVPVDDQSYSNFNLTIAHVQGEAAERYRAHPQSPRNQKRKAAWDEIVRLGEDILAGRRRLTVEDCGELARSVNLQDYVAQKGQGIIANRERERLGQSDKCVIMLRKLWSREIAKLAGGEPLKHWHWPGYLELKTGLD